MRYKFLLTLLMSILLITLSSCDSGKNKADDDGASQIPDEETPNVITLYRTAPISDLRLSSDNIIFETLTLNINATFAISFINDNTRFPAPLTFKQLPDNIKLDDRSTCKLSDNLILPRDSCVAIFIITPKTLSPIGSTVKYTDGINFRVINFTVNNIADNFIVNSDSLSKVFISKTVGEKGDVANFTIRNSSAQTMVIDIPTIDNGFLLYPLSACKEGLNNLTAGGSCVLSIIMNTPTAYEPYNKTIHIKTYTNISQVDAKKNINITLSGFYNDSFTEGIESISISEQTLNFGVALSDIRVAKTFTISNNSPYNNVRYLIDSPTDNFRYDESSTCGINGGLIVRWSSCDYTLLFTPTISGVIKDKIAVYVKSKSKSVELKAVYESDPLISLSDKIIDFGLIDNLTDIKRYIDIGNISGGDINLKFENMSSLKIDTTSECKNDTQLQSNASCRLILHLDTIVEIPKNISLLVNDVRYDIPIQFTTVALSANVSVQLGDYDIVNSTVGRFYDKIIFFKTAGEKKIFTLYNPMNDSFEDQLPLSQNIPYIDNSSISAVNDSLYFFGGDNEEGVLQNILYSFNISSKQFKTIIKQQDGLPQQRKTATLLTSGKTLFLYGGIDENGAILDDLYMLDLSSDNRSWVQLIGSSQATDKELMRAGLVYEKTIYLLSDKALYKYDTTTLPSSLTKLNDIATAGLSTSDITVDNDTFYIHKNAEILTLNITSDTDFKKLNISSTLKPKKYDTVKMIAINKMLYLFTAMTGKLTVDTYNYNILTSHFNKQNIGVTVKELSADSASALIDDKIYYFDKGKIFYYNINYNIFEELTFSGTTLPVAKYSAVAVGKNIYILASTSANFFVYNTINNSITEEGDAGDLTTLRYGFTLNYHDNIFYLYGGFNGADVLADFYKYDNSDATGSKRWSMLASNVADVGALYNYSSAVIDDKIYIVGGNNGTDHNNKVFLYDIATANFTTTIADNTLKSDNVKLHKIGSDIYISVNGNVKKYDNSNNDIIKLNDIDIFGDEVLLKSSNLSAVYGRLIYNFNYSLSKFDRILLKGKTL